MSCVSLCKDDNLLNCMQKNQTNCPSCVKLNLNNCVNCMETQGSKCPSCNLNNCVNCVETHSIHVIIINKFHINKFDTV